MSEIVIKNYQDRFRSQVDEIFFESSTKKEFKDAAEKEAFNWKYLGFYLAHSSEFAWVAIQDKKVLGYVLGLPNTKSDALFSIQPHLVSFTSDFLDYPAHLHINAHVDSRGKGIGQMLVARLFEQLRMYGVKGLHIMTGPDSKNTAFYRKLGFDYEHSLNGILLMGISL